MYYIYFPFIFILSGLMCFACIRQRRPLWWPAIVLAAPVTTPYFIFKFRTDRKLILLMMFFVSFFLVICGEFLIYSKMKATYKYDHLPPVTKQLIRYSEILKQTTQNLDNDLVELEQRSKVQSNVEKLEQTIVFIDELRQSMRDNQAAIEQMIEFVAKHKDFFTEKDLQWVYEINRFYNNRIVISHFKSLKNYLDNFETLLRFCYRNFDAITKAESTAHLKNYDEYYLRYRRAVDSHNRFNVKRLEFQNAFIQRYPEIKAYLPAKRQTEAFRLWE